MYKARFAIEDGRRYEGYTTGKRCNGWARPYFTREVAAQMVRDFNVAAGKKVAWYDYKEHAFTFEVDGGVDAFHWERVRVSEDSEAEFLYPIGAGCWIWTEIDEQTIIERIATELYGELSITAYDAVWKAWNGDESDDDCQQIEAAGIRMLDIGTEYYYRMGMK